MLKLKKEQKDFIEFAKSQGCQCCKSNPEGETIRIYYDEQDLGYVNPTISTKNACYGYHFWWIARESDACEDGKKMFPRRYGNLPGLCWHYGSGNNAHRLHLGITDATSARIILLTDMISVSIRNRHTQSNPTSETVDLLKSVLAQFRPR